MKIIDFAYGPFYYDEPATIELLKSKALIRLKSISKFGVPDKYWFRKNFSRFEHSVGVMNLLKLLGASPEEQIAGLLHDVSQFSFSHISDWVFGKGHEGNESYHDSQHSNYVLSTELPEILHKYGYSINRILDESNFTLLENHAPDICADRVDYCLREIAHNGDKETVVKVLNSMENYNNQIVFNDPDVARLFSDCFLDLQTNHWASAEGVRRYALFSQAIGVAVSTGFLKHDDFWNKSEKEILDILLKSGNPEISDLLQLLENKLLPESGAKRVYKKFRYVDPLVKQGTNLVRLTELDHDYEEILKTARIQNSAGVAV